jgi:glycosyltransferase involved in cell wall biosynthesis
LGDAIGVLAGDDTLRAQKARASRERALEKFIWERQAGKYLSVFEGLLPPPEPSADAIGATDFN